MLFSNFQTFFDPNTHSQCVFLDPTQQQGASKLQARKVTQTDTHSQCVLMAPNFENLKIVIFNVEEVTRFVPAGGSS